MRGVHSRNRPTRQVLGGVLGGALVLALGCGSAPPTGGPASAPTSAPTVPVVGAEAPDRTALPKPAPEPAWTPPAVAESSLANGMQVWHLERRAAPLLSLRFVFPAGAATDPAGKAGLTALTADLLDEGAGSRTALELSRAFQRLATDYSVSVSTDGVVFSLDLLADTLDASLALLADILRRPTLSEEEFVRRRAQRVAMAMAGEADPGTARAVVLRRALFGEGYGGYPANGIRRTLGTLSHEDVQAHHRALFQPRGVTVVAVGAVGGDALAAALRKHFGDWEGAPTATTNMEVVPEPAPAIHWVDFPGSTQSAVWMARRVGGLPAPDEEVEDVFNWTLGGAFTSRINMNLREEKGYTYGARSGFNRWRGAGFYGVGAMVKSDTTRLSVDEILAELRGISGARAITTVEFSEAVNGLRLGFPGRFERQTSIAEQYAAMVLEGKSTAWLSGWPARIGAVTMERAQAAATQTAQSERFSIVIAGDRAALAATLADLNLPIVEYDAQGDRK